MKAAAIDIGTNSVLLLIAETGKSGFEVVHEEQRIPRLGRGVDQGRTLSEESIHRTIDVLLEYRDLIKYSYPEAMSNVYVTATSAVRDSSNRDDFVEEVFEKTGWGIQILSGYEEAALTYKGALTVIKSIIDQASFVIDIGGGSTEFAFGKGSVLHRAFSLDMGCVRFTERYLHNTPPDPVEIETARESIRNLLSDQELGGMNATMIGVAGTVTALAGVEMNLDLYDASKLNGYAMSRQSVKDMADRFSVMHPDEIEKQYPLFMKGRGEVILAGLLILLEVMYISDARSLAVSTGGIQHGVIADRLLE